MSSVFIVFTLWHNLDIKPAKNWVWLHDCSPSLCAVQSRPLVIQCKCLILGFMLLRIHLLQISSKPFLLLQQFCSQYPLNVYNPCSVHPNRVFYELIFAMFKGYQPSQVFIFGRIKNLMSFNPTVSCINKGKSFLFLQIRLFISISNIFWTQSHVSAWLQLYEDN